MARKRARNEFKKLPRWLQFGIIVILVIGVAVAYFNQEKTPLPDGDLQITVIDVGNADSILIQSDGQAMLIDAGERGDGDEVLAALEDNGVTALDHVIATHADSDHIGGMKTVLEGIEVKNYIMSFMPKGYTPDTKTYTDLLETIDELNIQLTEAAVGQSFVLGEATVDILGPAEDFEDNNDQSVICKVTFGEKKFLFMGDAETAAEQALLETAADLSADVLKVGHHGSNTSTGEELLDRVDPSIALITCGADNSYGHPDAEVLERLKDADVEIYRCDVNGTIILRSDGKTVEVTPEKGEAT